MKGTKKLLCLTLSLVLMGMTGRQESEQSDRFCSLRRILRKRLPRLQDSDVDVLVIGAGGAGLSAAVSATENGASVIVVEKCRLWAATRRAAALSTAMTRKGRPARKWTTH